MTILVQQLRERALKATPGPWQHERLGIIQGGPMQTYVNGEAMPQLFTSHGADFMEPGDYLANADFVAAANPAAILALLDELEAANANHENTVAHMQSVCAERDRLKEENVQFLAAMKHIMNEVDGNLREIARDLINHGVSTYPESPANPNDIYEYCDTIERLIAGALPKEQP